MKIRCTAFLLLLLGVSAAGQETASLTGFVWDSSSALVPGAQIIAVNDETGFRREANTGAEGSYHFAWLNPGHYKMTVRRDGFHTLVQYGVTLGAAQSARLDFHLQIGSVEEQVIVTDEPPLLNTSDASVSTLVGRNWADRLPLAGRNLLTLLELAPGAIITPATAGEAGQFSVNGQRPNTNYFTIDGVSANTGVSGGGLPAQMPGGSLPNMTAFGSFHGLISVESLDEFRVQTSTAAPEHGRSPGGAVELSSRSGSNDFHGAFFDVLGNEVLDANDWFRNAAGSPRLPLRVQNFGATLGGPVRRNRTFFFLSYEGLRLKQPLTWESTVPSLAVRASAPAPVQPVLNAFPAPNGPDLNAGVARWTASDSRPSSFDGGSIRIDHALTGNLLLFGRYSQTPSSTQFGSSQIDTVNIHSASLTLGLNAVLSPSSSNEFRINRTATSGASRWQTTTNQPVGCYADVLLVGPDAPCASFYRFAINGIGELDAGINAQNSQQQWNAVNSFQIRRRRHQLRVGIDYRRLALDRLAPQTSVTVIANDLTSLLNYHFAVNVSQALQPRSSITDVSSYAGDIWQVSSKLTISGGLRWEFEPAPLAPAPSSVYFAPPYQPARDIPIWRTASSHFGAQVGLAWRLTPDGKTVLRSGYGLYVQPDFGAVTDGINGAPYNTWQFNNGPINGSPIPPATLITYAFSPRLRVPSITEWNTTLERALTRGDVLSVAYVGSAGGNLLRREVGSNSSATLEIITATSDGSSDYNSLQVQYRGRVSKDFAVLTEYVWSHSLDNGSADSALYWVPNGAAPGADRASSDFDVRHSVTAAVSFAPTRLFRNWSVAGLLSARSAFPITVLDAESVIGLPFANAFRPNLLSGVPLWIGRNLNLSAFALAAGQGNLGRNTIRGYGTANLDVSVRRSFSLGEKSRLEVRGEAFNLLNHPAFADPVRFLSSPLFGRSPSMLNLALGSGTAGTGLIPVFHGGGPRSVQLAVRLIF